MWEILSIFLQALGVLLLLWGLTGWLVLGRDRGGAAVYLCRPGSQAGAEAFLRCCTWLQGAGLMKMPVFLADAGLDENARKHLQWLISGKTDAAIFPAQELEQRLITEADKVGGAGSAAGNCGGDRISEP